MQLGHSFGTMEGTVPGVYSGFGIIARIERSMICTKGINEDGLRSSTDSVERKGCDDIFENIF